MRDPVDASKELVRLVVRMFYETEHMVVIDALCYHGALTIQDFVQILDAGKNSKAVGKIVGRLKEAGLCMVYNQQIKREGATKQTSKEYYYIDWRHAIDSCKYKIHKIHERVNKDAKPTTEKAEFKCPRCRSEFTMMDVIDRPDPEARASGFLCARCNYPLDEIDEGGHADDANDDTPAKFNKQFHPLITLMGEIDQLQIPAVEGKDAVASLIELPRDKTIDPGTKHEVIEDVVSRPTAVKGMVTGPEKISIQIGSSAEVNEKQRAADKARQEKIAMQNQLPSWHTKSTIVKESNGASASPAATKQETNGTDAPAIKTEQGVAKPATQDLDGIFAQIEAERRKKEMEEEEDEEDDEEEDDDEFEDVAVGMPSALPDAKRVKLELPILSTPSAAATPSNAATPAVSTGDGGEESEEDEFEDVN